jgi:hypothetical protein
MIGEILRKCKRKLRCTNGTTMQRCRRWQDVSRAVARRREAIEWFEGNFQDYEHDKMRRLGIDSVMPQRIKYKKFSR